MNLMTLPEWIQEQGRGAITRLHMTTGISYSTVHGAARGKRVTYDIAVKLSEATGSKVSVASLCEGVEDAA